MCGKQGNSTNTDCQNTPNKYKLNNITGSYKPQHRITERNQANEGHNSREGKRKMTGEKG